MGIKSHHRAPYFNKFSRSVLKEVRRSELAILASAYYTGRVHSILGQNLNIARHPHFGQFFAVHVRGHAILLKLEVIFFLNFFSRNLCYLVLIIPSVTFRPIRTPDHR